MNNDILIVYGSWDMWSHLAKPIRTQVFIQEQQIAEQDEWDDQDQYAEHFVLLYKQIPVATARLLANAHIGRVAVLKEYRGMNLGEALMQAVIDHAKSQNIKALYLSSQVHAQGFYVKLGFQAKGECYLDCGIPHIDMQLFC